MEELLCLEKICFSAELGSFFVYELLPTITYAIYAIVVTGKVELVRSFKVTTFIVLSYKKRICKIAHSFWYDIFWLSFLNTPKNKVT